MAGLVEKFVRGAAASGAKSFDRHAKDKILAEREKRLQALKDKSTMQQQKFRTQEREASEEFQSKSADKSREFESELVDKKHQQSKDMLDYQVEKVPGGAGGGVEPTANQKDVAAMVRAGVFDSDKEAWNFLNNNKRASSIVRMFQMLSGQQENEGLIPGSEGYKSPKQLLKQSEALISGLGEEDEQGNGSPFQINFGGNQGSNQASGTKEAPPAAVQFLNDRMSAAKNQDEKDSILNQFQEKFGYVPTPYKQ